MADPIQSSTNSSWYSIPEDTTAQENAAQMCSVSAQPSSETIANAASTPAPTAGTAPLPASGATLLVARFVTPLALPPAEPSLLKAVLNCGMELGNVALAAGAIAVSAPETFGATVLAWGKVLTAGVSFDRCATKSEAEQTQAAIKAAQVAACAAQGGVALSTTDGSALCAVVR